MNNWDPAAEPTLQHIDGTDLWYGEGEYELDARLDYKFVIDGQRWELDPLNPRIMLSGLGPNSELAMPEYETPAEVFPQPTPAPSGRLTEHTLESAALGQVRTFFVYTPASALIGEKPATVYIHDGGEYINLIDAPAMLDNLIAAGDIPPVVAVFIPPVQRELEYYLNDNYVRFLADELTPFMQSNYDVSPEPGKTANLGASLGGLLAVYAAATRPEVFGQAAGYSGAYSLGNDLVIDLIRREETLPLRFYLVVGTYETAIGGDPNAGNLLEANRRLARALHDRFYDYQYEEAPQGHSWGLWRDFFGDGLRFLFQR
jgi:enterochelin esterase family protein